MQTKANFLAKEDEVMAKSIDVPRFSLGTRPVIRWIKGDGLDDAVTRAAIAQATRIFGSEVDYCLCTVGISAFRARTILEWAAQPVEWWPISENDNLPLAELLLQSGCLPEKFGYWWKWFPERVRPGGPEWILDGDMVITAKPSWYEAWRTGKDQVRITQDDWWFAHDMYGKYLNKIDLNLKFYSGLISLPPNQSYMPQVLEVMHDQQLDHGHDGTKDICEQGVIAVAFQKLKALPIPLNEFPFARSFEGPINFGKLGDQGVLWGYHFGGSFKKQNHHFYRLIDQGIIFSKQGNSLLERFKWLGGLDQWGLPGWTMPDASFNVMLEQAVGFAGKRVLEMGTSRGRLSAGLCAIGCYVTTVDYQDRGAAKNLSGLTANVVQQEAIEFLSTTSCTYDLIIFDLHGNSVSDWEKYAKPLLAKLNSGGKLCVHNVFLGEVPEWHEEKGVLWFIQQLPSDWKVEIFPEVFPGIAAIYKP